MVRSAHPLPASGAARRGGRDFALEGYSLSSEAARAMGMAVLGNASVLGPFEAQRLTPDNLSAQFGGQPPSEVDVYVTAPEKPKGYLWGTDATLGETVSVGIFQVVPDADHPGQSTIAYLGGGEVPWGKQLKFASLPIDTSKGGLSVWTGRNVPIQVAVTGSATHPAPAGTEAAKTPPAPGEPGSIAPKPKPDGDPKLRDRLWVALLVVLVVLAVVVIVEVAATAEAVRPHRRA